MMRKTLTSLAVAAGCLTMASAIPAVQAQMMQPEQVITNGPQSSGVERSGNWSARANVSQSERYERLVNTNRGFRHGRMAKECGPITDPQLHQQCVASFSENESTMSGSSTAPNDYGDSSGR
jgi:hypothetical protein